MKPVIYLLEQRSTHEHIHTYTHTCLVPNTPSAMRRNGFDLCFLSFLGEVIQEEVEEDSVDFDVGVEVDDFSAEQLDGPDAAAWLLCEWMNE